MTSLQHRVHSVAVSRMFVRGNKGTLFVLQKTDVREDPLALWASKRLTPGARDSTPAAYTPSEITPTSLLSSPQRPAVNPFIIPSWLAGSLFPRAKDASAAASTKEDIIIIFPCQLGEATDYVPLQRALAARGRASVVVPLTRVDWIVSFTVVLMCLCTNSPMSSFLAVHSPADRSASIIFQ